MKNIITIKALIAVAMLAGFTTSPLLMAMQQPQEDRHIPLYINTLDGKYITVMVKPSMTIGDLKNLIFKEKGIPVADQRLITNGKDTNNDTQKLIEINNGSMDLTITLIIRKQTPNRKQTPKYPVITVRTDDGKTTTLQLDPSTSTALRGQIQEVTGIDIDKKSITVQVLKSE